MGRHLWEHAGESRHGEGGDGGVCDNVLDGRTAYHGSSRGKVDTHDGRIVGFEVAEACGGVVRRVRSSLRN